jgi:TnpA family transposase
MHNLNRLYLLPDAEIADLYARPIFNKNEQHLYFSMNKLELDALNQFGVIKTKVYFILQLAYFKAKNQFFTFEFEDVRADVDYVMSTFFKNSYQILQSNINRKLIKQQKQCILSLFNYKDWSSAKTVIIENHACELLRYYPKVHDTFRQLLAYLDNQRIVIPTYRNLQDLLTKAIAKEDKRLEQLINLIPQYKQEQLSALIVKEDGVTQLNTIRSDQKNFTFTQTRAEVSKALEISELYEFAKSFIPTLLLSKNAIRYYADLTDQYPASRLRRLNKTQQWLQILCFVYYRYQQIMDNLITSFMYHIRKITSEGEAYVEKKMGEYNAGLTVDFPKLAKFLHWFPKRNPDLNHDELNKAAYKILPQKQFPVLAKFLEGNTFDKKAAMRDFYLKSTRLCALYLRPILLNVPFVFYKENSDVIHYINLIKNHYDNRKSPSTLKIPKEVEETIPSKILSYLQKTTDDKEIDPYLFEFFVYHKMYRRLNNGLLCCNESVSYCDIDHDLVKDALVDDVEKIATEFGFSKLPIYCDQRLDEALQQLDDAWDKTTRRINLGENTGFSITETKTGEQDWKLEYDNSEELDDAFFKNLSQIGIADIVMYIGDRINIWDSFSHMKSRYTKKKKANPLTLNACILSDAFGIGIEKMSEISDLDHNLLRSTQEDFMRIDNLEIANDQVSNLVHALPIFKLWNLMDDKLLADADGQKLATSESTIQSRYSKKYLGKSPGLSIYTLIANFIAVNAKNIGLNEYEGHSLYDVIYGNKTNISIDMVTGDNHSLNKHNFVILDSIDVDYVPSIKDIKEAANHLYSVKSPEHYTGIICSQGIIDKNLIKSQKRGILRVLISLLLQENTQSNIVRKINSYARYTELKKALFEYNNVFKSTHVLNLIDSMTLRKAIRTARNRTESYHQLQGRIRKIYSGVFKGKKITTNQTSAHAVRLVANCVIAFSAIILNAVYEKMLKEGVNQAIINEFARISPIAWAHIVFTGKYNFKKSDDSMDLGAMVDALEKHLKQHFWKVAKN